MKIKRYGGIALLFAVMFLTACGDDNAGKVVTGNYYNPTVQAGEDKSDKDSSKDQTPETEQETKNASAEPVIGADLFLITNNDMQEECLILKQLASGKQYMYSYSVVTRFQDKYGKRTSVSSFEPGRVMTVGEKDSKGRIIEAQLSDQVWEYPDITKYSFDEGRGVFDIAGTKYSFDENLYVNSDGNFQKLSDLSEMDVLRVVGIDKKILAISVTTGHGELQLANTKIFEGSFIQIGNKIFTEITPDMLMEIPEGTYTVAVANDGYGGSTEIEIKRGQTTLLDLDTLKGEGPKYGDILFAIDVADAVLKIDGKTVDYSKPVSLRYGVHTLTVTAESYDAYSKKLYVNSKEATIVIELTGGNATAGISDEKEPDDTDTDDDDDDADAPEDEADTPADGTGLAGSLAGSHTGGGTNEESGQTEDGLGEARLNAMIEELLNKNEEKEDSAADYLSTLTELISDLKGQTD